MRSITQEQLDERCQKVCDYRFDPAKPAFHHPLAEYQGETLQEKIYFKWADELNRLRIAFEKKKNPSDTDLKTYNEKIKENEKDIADQIGLANRHDKNLVWVERMRRVGIIACLSTALTLCGGMMSIPLVGKELHKNPVARTLGAFCMLSLMVSWAGALEVGRLERSNRRIVKSLKTWHVLKPEEKEKVKNREVYSVHQGLSGFLETFERA